MSESTHFRPSAEAGSQELIDDQALDWFVLLSSAQPTEEQRLAFQRWLAADNRHQRAYDELDTLDADLDGLRDAFAPPLSPVRGAQQVDAVPAPVYPLPFKASRRWPPIKHLWSAAIAACFALVLVNIPRFAPGMLADYQTAVGEQVRVELPDGSIAWLNTDSAIDVDYSEERRQINLLRGEALFEVAKNPNRPFSVNAAGGRSTALGTVYCVHATHNNVEVTVTEGTVEVVSPLAEAAGGAGSAHRVVLTRNQQVRYVPGELPGVVSDTAPNAQVAWRNGFIDIRNRPLADALAEIDRYHPGRIVLLADSQTLQPVTARLSIASVDNGLDALVSTQGLSVTRLTDYLVLVR